MKIQTVKEYNKEDLRKWHERVDEWKADKFTHNIIPQVAFVGFKQKNGEMRQKGYVASDEHSAYFAETKKEVIKKFNKEVIRKL